MKFDDLLNEIKGCLNDKHYLGALSLALTIPDICGSIEYPNIGVGQRYKEWYKTYIGKNQSLLNEYYDCENFPWIDEEIVYSIRNNMFHEDFPKVKAVQIHKEVNKADIFYLALYESSTFTATRTEIITENREQKTIKKTMINVPYLCELLVNAGSLFYINNKDKFNIDDSMEEYYSTDPFKITFIK